MRIAALACACFMASCAPTPTQISALVEPGHDNEFRAKRELEGNRYRLSGELLYFGLKSRKVVVHDLYGVGYGVGTAESRLVRRKHPVVTLRESEAVEYLAECHFPMEDAEQLADLSRGTTIEVSGEFRGYRHSSKGLVAILGDCSLE